MQSENESLRMKLDDSHNKLQRQEEATTKAEVCQLTLFSGSVIESECMQITYSELDIINFNCRTFRVISRTSESGWMQ